MTTKETLEKILKNHIDRDPIITKDPTLEGYRVAVTFSTWEYFRKNMTEDEVKKHIRRLILEIAELAILDTMHV